MTSLKIYSTDGKETGSIEMPTQFSEPVKYSLIKKVVLALRANARQRYGAYRLAGQQVIAKLSHRRRKYKGAYGFGISRIPRMTLSRRGTQFMRRGAFAPSTIGGRRAHPPKAEKIWSKTINKKENRAAIRSALAASIVKSIVERRGHKLGKNYPFVLDNTFESLEKTKQVKDSLLKLDLNAEMNRVGTRKIRAGQGKGRGRKYKTKSGPLIVVGDECKLQKAARNLVGVEVVNVRNINAKLLAPGNEPGRLTLYTKNAVEALANDKLYM